MLLPQIVQHLQHNLALDLTHLVAHMGVAAIIGGLHLLNNLVSQGSFIQATIFIQPLLHWQWRGKVGSQRFFKALYIPLLFEALWWYKSADTGVNYILANIGNHLGNIFVHQ